mgnify:CR=1 FL=1
MEMNDTAIAGLLDTFFDEFPGFTGFEAAEGPYYAQERQYKDEFLAELDEKFLTLLRDPSPVTEQRARALLNGFDDALGTPLPSAGGPQNLINWRYRAHFGKLEGQAAIGAAGALRDLWQSSDSLPEALEAFGTAYASAAGTVMGQDAPMATIRSLGSLVLCARSPGDAIFIRTNLWTDIMRRVSGRRSFANAPITADEYRPILEIADRVRKGLAERGFPVRDHWDTYSVLWRAHAKLMGSSKDGDSDSSEGNEDMNDITRPAHAPAPENLILYGPPGTGKTYAMAEEAVRLCDGRLPAPDRPETARRAVQARYEELRERGRIEFVTFHQSYSYEEFVEGLRPDTGSEDDTGSAVGFRLQPENGVFRRISRLAEKAKAPSGSNGTLPRTNVFKTSLGPTWDESFAYLFDECIENGYILLGYGGEVDWSPPEFRDFKNIHTRWKQIDPEASGYDPNVVQIFSLRTVMAEGDLVVVSNGNLRFRAIGRVTGPYQFVKRDQDEYHHRRAVDWLWVDREGGLSHSDIYDKRFSQQTLYKMVDSAIKWPALEEIVTGNPTEAGEPPAYVLIIDEINRANISKVFGELITLLEPDKRLGAENELRVRLPYSKDEFGVPANLHVLGTMNTADRSIALLDTALRRRFEFRETMPRPELLSTNIDGVNLRSVLTVMNERIEYLYDRDHQIGHAYFMGCASRSDIDGVVRQKIIPLLVEYFYEDWEKVRMTLGETRDSGAFISRSTLNPSLAGLGEMEGEPRWRYAVRDRFPADAYEQLSS